MKRILILAACTLVLGAAACTQQANQPAASNQPAPQANTESRQAPGAAALTYELKIDGMT